MKTLATFSQAVIALTLLMSIGLTGCQKKRTPKLPYGADRDLLTIASYENKDWDLNTKGLIARSNTNEQLKVEDTRKMNSARVKNFDYVDYEAKDPLNLTDKTLMLGRPNFQYKIRYVFEGSLLKVMKVSRVEDLAYDEIITATDAGNGLKMVPIVSYSVAYYTVDTSRNDLNEKTSRLELINQQNRGSSSHFRVELNSKTAASFLQKSTVLPSNFFTSFNGSQDSDGNDWYFAVTVISQNESEDRGYLGAHISVDKYGKEASKVRARIDEGKISFYNVAVDRRLKDQLESREEIQSMALVLPVEFTDFKFSEAGKGTSVKEEKFNARAWKERAYIDLKLSQAQASLGDLKIRELKDVQIDDGYFSFTVHSDTVGGLAKISLYNVKAYKLNQKIAGASPYEKGKIYFRDDHQIFGFFKTAEVYSRTSDRVRTKDLEKMVYVNRFNPTRKIIEYRLNHNAPQWTEEYAETSVKAWNSAFERAGLDIRINLWDQNNKVLRGHPGDLRYSLLNMYTGVDGAGPWGGFGPSIADPDTGEIIMATSNMDIYGYIDGIENALRGYLLSSNGELESKYVVGSPLPSLKPIVDIANKTIQFIGRQFGVSKTFRTKNVYDPETRSFIKGVKDISKTADISEINFSNYQKTENRYNDFNKDLLEKAKFHCPELVQAAEAAKQNKTEVKLESQAEVLKKCAQEIARYPIISHLLHEMGHNLGLRHNFKGSADWQNFFAPVTLKKGDRTIQVQWKSSTVMDYLPLNHLDMIHPGEYDIAALRWGYGGKVITKSGAIVPVSDDKPIRQQVSDYKHYFYCTDENDFKDTDTMCSKFDIGETPTKIVKNIIDTYDNEIATYNFRHGRDRMPNTLALAEARIESYLIPMKLMYEQWRLILNSQAGVGNEYLESYDTKEKYEALIKRVLDPNVVGATQAAWNAEYRKAAEMIFSFLNRLAFLPDYSCIATRESGNNAAQTAQLFPFSKIQRIIFNTSGTTTKSCQDKEVQEYLLKQKQAKVIAEVGHSFDNIYGDLSEIQSTNTDLVVDRPEVLGIAQDRANALSMLIEREPHLHQTKLNRFLPNFMDEWIFREILTTRIVNRLTKGISLQELGLSSEFIKKFKNTISPNFESEKPLLSMMYDVLRIGQSIPNKSVESNKRLQQYAVFPVYMLDGENNPECAIINGMNWCATDLHPVSKSLLVKLKTLQQLKMAIKIGDNSLKTFYELTQGLIPPSDQFEQLDITFLDAMNERVEKLRKDSSNAELVSEIDTLMTVVFSPEISIWNEGTQKARKKISEEDLGKDEFMKKVAELKKIKIKDLVQKMGVEQYEGLTTDTLVKRVNKFVEKLRDNAKNYEADQTELDAQADLILEALIGGRSL